MAKVQINQTPSQQLVDKAKAEVETTDARGRVMVLRKPGMLAQYRLVEMLGDSAANQTYMAMVLPLLYLASIDGRPIVLSSKRELDALIAQLEEEGIEALMRAMEGNFGAPSPDEDKAKLKNS